jgi:hypothetical protein
MNASEPVAWMHKNPEYPISKHRSQEYNIPLYTHPEKEYKPNQTLECSFDLAGFKPPAKTLTDEEIRHIQAQCHLKDVGYDTFIMRFARAILRKAQEK